MGVEFRLYVIPQKADFRPSAAALTDLVTQLAASGWLPAVKKPKKNELPVAGHQLRLGSGSKKGPLTSAWFEQALEPSPGALKTNLKAEWSVSWDALTMDTAGHPIFEEIPEHIELSPEEVFFALKLECPRSMSGVSEEGDVPRAKLKSGGRYRFALIVDCGKCFWDTDDDLPRLRPELESLITKALGVPVEQIGEVY